MLEMLRFALPIRLGAVAASRAFWDRLRHPPNAAMALVALAVVVVWGPGLIDSLRMAMEEAGTSPEPLRLRFFLSIFVTAAIAVLHGWRISILRALRDPARDPWLVLGGAFQVSAVRELAAFSLFTIPIFGLVSYIAWPSVNALPAVRPVFQRSSSQPFSDRSRFGSVDLLRPRMARCVWINALFYGQRPPA